MSQLKKLSVKEVPKVRFDRRFEEDLPKLVNIMAGRPMLTFRKG